METITIINLILAVMFFVCYAYQPSICWSPSR